MVTLTKKNFDNPDETMTPPKTRVDNVDLGNGQTAMRIKAEPGWKWSELTVVKKHILAFV